MKKPLFYAGCFCLGGLGYVGLEVLFRGFSDISMFFAGGICFVLIQRIDRSTKGRPIVLKCALGACMITAVEALFGCLVNTAHTVWDYSDWPLNWRGQICLPFSALWGVLTWPALHLGRWLEKGRTRSSEACAPKKSEKAS